MDLGEFRSFVLDSGIDVWTWIDLAISMASADYENELKNRRDGIIQKLYSPPFSKCQNCDHQLLVKREQNIDLGCDYNTEILQEGKMVVGNEEKEEEGEEEDEQGKVLEIKFLLDDHNQGETCLISLLQKLVDMDVTFKVLKETDIGRHVTQFRKHTSTEVRRLVKILVRKWKDTVDEWVRLNSPMEDVAQDNGDKESCHESQYKNSHQNGVNGYANSPHHLTPQKGKVKDKHVESDNYSATKRLQSDHHEDHYGKKPRTGQVSFQHIPKAKNALVTTNRGSVPVKY